MSESNGALSHLITRYRALLRKEASPHALEETLALVNVIASSSVEMPRDESLEVFEPLLQQVRVNRPKLKIDAEQRRTIYRITAALTLPRFLRNIHPNVPTQRASLLLDAAQVLFHQAYFVLVADRGILPPGARRNLLDVFLHFAEQLPSRADSFRTVALVLDAMGQPEAADYSRRQSLRETPSTAHEYLTVLQTAWSGYIDHKRFGLAMLLLLEEIGNDRVSSDNFPEFLELAELTLELWRDSKRATASSAKS